MQEPYAFESISFNFALFFIHRCLFLYDDVNKDVNDDDDDGDDDNDDDDDDNTFL